MFRYKDVDYSSNWLLFEIHKADKRKDGCLELGFWAKLGLWLKGKL